MKKKPEIRSNKQFMKKEVHKQLVFFVYGLIWLSNLIQFILSLLQFKPRWRKPKSLSLLNKLNWKLLKTKSQYLLIKSTSLKQR